MNPTLPRFGARLDGVSRRGRYAAFFFSARSISAGVTTSERPRGIMRPSRASWLNAREIVSRQLPIMFASSCCVGRRRTTDRKSTRLNSSHSSISYAVFCLKKKKKKKTNLVRSKEKEKANQYRQANNDTLTKQSRRQQ